MTGGYRPTAVIEARTDRCQGKPGGHYYRRDRAGVWRCAGCPSTRVLLRYGIPTLGYPQH